MQTRQKRNYPPYNKLEKRGKILLNYSHKHSHSILLLILLTIIFLSVIAVTYYSHYFIVMHLLSHSFPLFDFSIFFTHTDNGLSKANCYNRLFNSFSLSLWFQFLTFNTWLKLPHHFHSHMLNHSFFSHSRIIFTDFISHFFFLIHLFLHIPYKKIFSHPSF